MTVQLITIITVPQSQRVKCQHPGCTRNVFSKIHVVRKNGEITFVGGRCFQKLFGDLNLEPVFGGGGGIRLSEAEREKILQNTDEFLAELQTIYEESDIEEPKTPEVTVGVLDSVICAAIDVSIAVTSSEPIAALAQATALSLVTEA